jgi:hypothetical protein
MEALLAERGIAVPSPVYWTAQPGASHVILGLAAAGVRSTVGRFLALLEQLTRGGSARDSRDRGKLRR